MVRILKNTRHISRRVHFVRNGEKCKVHNIDWRERCLKWAEIETNNVGENDLNHGMKYIMVSFDNLYITPVKEG